MAKPNRGGRGGYEPRARVTTRQARAWKLSVAGWTQREIADDLGVSQPAVCKMLQRTSRDVMHDMRKNTDVYIARHVAQLEALRREVAAAWEMSKTDPMRRRHERVDGGGSDAPATGTNTLHAAVVTCREGDPRFSGQMMRLLAELWKVINVVATNASVDRQAPADPYAEMKRKLTRLPDEELVTVKQYGMHTLFLSEAAREIFDRITPEELEAMAQIMRKWERGEFNDPDET